MLVHQVKRAEDDYGECPLGCTMWDLGSQHSLFLMKCLLSAILLTPVPGLAEVPAACGMETWILFQGLLHCFYCSPGTAAEPGFLQGEGLCAG